MNIKRPCKTLLGADLVELYGIDARFEELNEKARRMKAKADGIRGRQEKVSYDEQLKLEILMNPPDSLRECFLYLADIL
jgi:hypothetical protein